MSGHSHGHGSNTSVYVILVTTFLFGFICGGLIFLYTNTDTSEVAEGEPVSKALRVTAQSYGGCESVGGCPSYSIAADGAYTFIARDGAGNVQTFEDELTKKQLDSLRSQAEEVDFDTLTKSTFEGACPAAEGRLSERYTIEYQGVRYEFDTCKQNIVKSPLFNLLRDYFVVFSTLHN